MAGASKPGPSGPWMACHLGIALGRGQASKSSLAGFKSSCPCASRNARLEPMGYKDPEQRREYARRWIATRRATWLAGKSCAVCGSVERLEIDHVDPSQKLDHRVWSWRLERRDAELAKCQVLCEPHHMEKTIRQRGEHVQHGTAVMYRWRGCRCDDCRDWKLQSSRRYNLTRTKKPGKQT